jgi:hypothetical protein
MNNEGTTKVGNWVGASMKERESRSILPLNMGVKYDLLESRSASIVVRLRERTLSPCEKSRTYLVRQLSHRHTRLSSCQYEKERVDLPSQKGNQIGNGSHDEAEES